MTETLSSNRQLFASIIKRREERVDLALTALLIAKEEYPGLFLEEYLQRLDYMAAEFQMEVNVEADAMTVCRGLANFITSRKGFHGNVDDYYDPRNSYLSDVMDRRSGIPITLCIIYLEIARRAGLKLLPVSFPGHFLVKLPTERGEIFMDPFHDGQIMDEEACQQLLYNLYGPGFHFSSTMLASATRRQLITRLLMNLKSIYLRQQDIERSLRVIDLLVTISPWDLDQIRDRGHAYHALGRVDKAKTDLETYARHAPPGPEVESVMETIRRLA